MTASIIQMDAISRRYGSVQALDSVNFAVPIGSITALVGENGAGKTTLMRVLYGAERPDSGTIHIDGKPVKWKDAANAIAHGVGMVSQHYSIIPNLSCIENLMLGAEAGFRLNIKLAIERAQDLANRMGFDFDWLASASTLSPAAAQKLEILKLLWRKAKFMILDEPTAMLSPSDASLLFQSLQQLARDGAGIVVVTHRIPEVLEHCQDVTVLRGGKLIESRSVTGLQSAELAELIVGKSVEMGRRTSFSGQQMAHETMGLEVSGLTVKGYRGDEAVKSVDFLIRKGEMLGVAGVDGSGQRELLQCLLGLVRPVAGSVTWNGKDLSGLGVASRIQMGFRLIPEDRHNEGVIDSWSLTDNAIIGLQRLSDSSQNGWLRMSSQDALTLSIANRFSTKRGALNSKMQSLSGGNQQRFVAARALALHPKLIVAFQPARGLDIEATRQVYEGIAGECANGASAIVVSFDLDELIDQCDRIVAMNRGRVFEAPPGLESDRETIGQLMVATA